MSPVKTLHTIAKTACIVTTWNSIVLKLVGSALLKEAKEEKLERRLLAKIRLIIVTGTGISVLMKTTRLNAHKHANSAQTPVRTKYLLMMTNAWAMM
jgi:hypothetical protein